MTEPNNNQTDVDAGQIKKYAEDLARVYKSEKEKRLQLERANQEISTLLSSINSILIGLSLHDSVTHWNKAAEEIFGIKAEEVLNCKISDFDIEWEQDSIYAGISKCLSKGTMVLLSDMTFRNSEGKNCLLGISINPIRESDGTMTGFLINGKDITERRTMERQLSQSGKMAAIGELATGIAHELNQPLNVIKIATQLIIDSVDEKDYTDEFLKERAEKIIAQVGRASKIITHLRTFGRKEDANFIEIDPNLPIHDAFDLLGEQLKMHLIGFTLDLDNNLPAMMGDTYRLEQVFINLIVNSRDSFDDMKKSSEGPKHITVRSSYLKDEKSILIEFTDNGSGIPDEDKSRIFEPFFTTKEIGKGTGLGLSISYGLIQSHRGTIEVMSGDDGSTFRIKFPIKERP